MKNLLLIALVTLSQTISSQSRFDKIEIKTHPITDNIYMLEGSGGNIGLYVGENEILMIDSQFGPLSKKITSAIRSLSDLPIKWLVNTHWHGDHTGGNENFAKQGVTLIGHENVLKRQREGSSIRKIEAASIEAQVDITYSNDLSLNVNGYDIYVHHVDDAHTDGDAFVFFTKDNVMHMGDCFFNGRFPYIDLSSGGSVKGYLRALEGALMMSDDDTVIIPGHGKIASKEDLKSTHTMLNTLINRMEAAMVSTDLLSDISINEITAGFEGWGDGYISDERIVEILFKGL